MPQALALGAPGGGNLSRLSGGGVRREPPVPEYSGCSPAQILCLLSGGENSSQLGEEPFRL